MFSSDEPPDYLINDPEIDVTELPLKKEQTTEHQPTLFERVCTSAIRGVVAAQIVTFVPQGYRKHREHRGCMYPILVILSRVAAVEATIKHSIIRNVLRQIVKEDYVTSAEPNQTITPSKEAIKVVKELVRSCDTRNGFVQVYSAKALISGIYKQVLCIDREIGGMQYVRLSKIINSDITQLRSQHMNECIPCKALADYLLSIASVWVEDSSNPTEQVSILKTIREGCVVRRTPIRYRVLRRKQLISTSNEGSDLKPLCGMLRESNTAVRKYRNQKKKNKSNVNSDEEDSLPQTSSPTSVYNSDSITSYVKQDQQTPDNITIPRPPKVDDRKVISEVIQKCFKGVLNPRRPRTPPQVSDQHFGVYIRPGNRTTRSGSIGDVHLHEEKKLSSKRFKHLQKPKQGVLEEIITRRRILKENKKDYQCAVSLNSKIDPDFCGSVLSTLSVLRRREQYRANRFRISVEQKLASKYRDFIENSKPIINEVSNFITNSTSTALTHSNNDDDDPDFWMEITDATIEDKPNIKMPIPQHTSTELLNFR